VRALRRDLTPNGETMLAEQLHTAAAGARTTASLDNLARLLWRAHAENQIIDPDAEAISEAIQARKGVLAGEGAQTKPKGVLGLSRGSSRPREKMFGLGRPRALDRNAKVRIMHWARCLARRTEKGKAYGQISAKAVAVLEALLWAFHNAKSGVAGAEKFRGQPADRCLMSELGVSQFIASHRGGALLCPLSQSPLANSLASASMKTRTFAARCRRCGCRPPHSAGSAEFE